MPPQNQDSPEKKPVGNVEETLPGPRTNTPPSSKPLNSDSPTVSLHGGATPAGEVAETLAATPTTPPRGRAGPAQIGEYEILSEIARGGMGVVYKARHRRLGRLAAIKLIKAGDLAGSDEIKRFHAEAAAVSQLDHPNIVPVFEAGEYHGQQFMALAFVDGPSLWKRVQESPLEPKEAARLMQQVSWAIQYAHEVGIVHRDLKPQNILVTSDGTPKVTDFGLAKRQHTDSSLTGTGMALGTPSYMPPEQAAGQNESVGPHSDVYSLGATLYALLTGRAPFQAANTLETLMQVMTHEPISPRILNPAIPRDLETICLKCLRKEAGKRYTSAAQLADDLGCWLEHKPILARPVSAVERTWLWCKRRPALVGLSLTFLMLLLAGTLFAWEQQHAIHAAGLVAELESAETVQVPDIVKRLNGYRRWVGPLLTQELRNLPDGSREKLHFSLALLPVDSTQVDYLYNRLLDVEAEQVAVIRDALGPYKDAVQDKLWAVVEKAEKGKETQRLRAAAALATYDRENQRWDKASKLIVEQLVRENPVFLGPWMACFRPIKEKLQELLEDIYRNPNWRESERSLATSILADYVADQPQTLVELLLDADDQAFAVIYTKFKEQGAQVLPMLTGEIDKKLPADLPFSDDKREKLAKRQANAAVALLRMNQPEKVWPLLKHGPDPRVRSYLIHRLSPMGADSKALVDQLEAETDITIQRALLLSLGEFGETAFTPDDRKAVLLKAQEIYRTSSDSGLHAASEWLLRTWKQDEWLTNAKDRWANDGEWREKKIAEINHWVMEDGGKTPPQWYVNTLGQTMTVIPGPVEFMMGSPETEKDREDWEQQHRRRIGRSFAIAAKSVTVVEYHGLMKTNAEIGSKYKRYPDVPMIMVSWYMAAKYCNLLSKEERIPEEQWCFETGPDGQVTKLKENYLSLTGYRLPTEAEMEYAVRAGAITSRFYGETAELLGYYAWFGKNSGDTVQRVGTKKPNDFGLFDVQGSCYSWCQEPYDRYPKSGDDETVEDKEVSKDQLVVDPKVSRVARGGVFYYLSGVERSAYRFPYVPTNSHIAANLRPTRTLSTRPTTIP